jgi:adenosyl cobinamide kinase/adenosyl cobinamide phosphate guanylyltransferase
VKETLDPNVNWSHAGDSSIVIITGPNNSGKSLYAESQLMSQFCRPLYVGTLPKSEQFHGRIKRHVDRRAEHWRLVEFAGEETRDGHNFRVLSKLADGILLDGLSSHLWFKHFFYGGSSESLMGYAHRLLRMLKEPSKPVVLVDCESPFPQGGQNAWFNDFIRELHDEIGAMGGDRIDFTKK